VNARRKDDVDQYPRRCKDGDVHSLFTFTLKMKTTM
jgi:hypothetical protein